MGIKMKIGFIGMGIMGKPRCKNLIKNGHGCQVYDIIKEPRDEMAAAGADPNLVLAAIRGGLAGSTVMEAKVPMMLAGDTKPGFRIDLHIKDLKNALEAGHEAGMGLPFTAQVMEMMRQLSADGFGGSDHSAIAHYYEKLAGVALQDEKA